MVALGLANHDLEPARGVEVEILHIERDELGECSPSVPSRFGGLRCEQLRLPNPSSAITDIPSETIH